MNAYEGLVEIARRQAGAIAGGHFDQVEALDAEWDALVALLPQQPPITAQPELEEALRIVEQNALAIAGHLGQTGGDLRRVAGGRRAVAGYAGAGLPPRLELTG
jgi:hypothetical protein